MTTEDDFQAALDANPEDWQTRLVFADWLQERGDPRAEGYRALGVSRRRPYVGGFDNTETGRWLGAGWFGCEGKLAEDAYTLPEDWFRAIKGFGKDLMYRPRYVGKFKTPNRRTIEDAAALAFARLPAARRAELLAAPPPAKPRKTAKSKPRRRKPRK